jgi:hypothetical protein
MFRFSNGVQGGTLQTSGGGVDLGANSALSALTLGAGSLSGNGAVAVSGLTTLNGATINTGGAIAANGGVNLTANSTLNRSLTVASNTTFDVKGDFGVSGAGSITNSGTFQKSVGTGTSTIGTTFTNNGTVTAKSGTLAFSNGVQGGTLQTNGGSLTLGGNSTAQALSIGTGSGTLNLGANKITVSGDYNNANFGTGNGFDRHANVTGTGAINAAGSAPLTYQQISAGDVKNMTTGNVTASYGIVGHVGDKNVTGSFQISNASGTNGVTLRGAVQDSAGGSNWVAAAGDTVNKTVSFNTSTAGATSTQVTVVNNFDNTNSQVLTANGVVNNYAVASFSSNSGSLTGGESSYTFNLGNFAKGSSGIASLSVLNAGGAAAYTDLLKGDFTVAAGSLFTLSNASFASLGGGSSQALSLSFNTNTAGSFSDKLTLTYYGFNASGYKEALKTVDFTVNASVLAPVPEPETWGMVLVGLGVISLRVRAMKDRSNKIHS